MCHCDVQLLMHHISLALNKGPTLFVLCTTQLSNPAQHAACKSRKNRHAIRCKQALITSQIASVAICDVVSACLQRMAVCDGCQQERPHTFKCGQCRSVQYRGKDCQKSSWKQHKGNCRRASDVGRAPRQMAVLLGEGFSVKAVSIEKAPVQIPVVRHHFDQHRQVRDSSFEDILLPVSDRLFGRAMRLVYDRSSGLQSNRFANRDSCALDSGFGLEIKGQVGSSSIGKRFAEMSALIASAIWHTACAAMPMGGCQTTCCAALVCLIFMEVLLSRAEMHLYVVRHFFLIQLAMTSTWGTLHVSMTKSAMW